MPCADKPVTPDQRRPGQKGNTRMKILHVALASAILASTSVAALGQAFSDKDKSFLKDSAQDNMAEVKLAELAIKTTHNPRIKTFAEKMVTDHTALLNGARPVAMKAGVTPPRTDGLEAGADYLKLKVLSGDTFDKSYVKTMVSDHHGDLDKINAEHDATMNPDMKKLTAHAATVVEGHTKMIDSIAGAMGLQ
jgi:putative membrane protein